MHFCQDEDSQDTQCCLFNDAAFEQSQNQRSSKDGLCGFTKNKNLQKVFQGPLKQTRLITKNHRKIKSHQKGKVSLSKLSAKRGNSCRDHRDHNGNMPMGRSNASNGRSIPAQRPNLNATFQKNNQLQQQSAPNHKLIGQQPINSNNRQQLYFTQNVHKVHQYKAQGNYSNYIVGSNNYRGQNISSYQISNHPNFFPSPHPEAAMQTPIQFNQLRMVNRRASKHNEQTIYTQNKIQNAVRSPQYSHYMHHLRHENDNNHHNLQIHQAPYTIYESNIRGNFEVEQSVARSKIRILKAEEIQSPSPYSGSHSRRQQSPIIDRNLKTVYSFYSSELNHHPHNFASSNIRQTNLAPSNNGSNLMQRNSRSKARQIDQSVIVIDFFNPSQSRKQELQANIQNRYQDQQNF